MDERLRCRRSSRLQRANGRSEHLEHRARPVDPAAVEVPVPKPAAAAVEREIDMRAPQRARAASATRPRTACELRRCPRARPATSAGRGEQREDHARPSRASGASVSRTGADQRDLPANARERCDRGESVVAAPVCRRIAPRLLGEHGETASRAAAASASVVRRREPSPVRRRRRARRRRPIGARAAAQIADRRRAPRAAPRSACRGRSRERMIDARWASSPARRSSSRRSASERARALASQMRRHATRIAQKNNDRRDRAGVSRRRRDGRDPQRRPASAGECAARATIVTDATLPLPRAHASSVHPNARLGNIGGPATPPRITLIRILWESLSRP